MYMFDHHLSSLGEVPSSQEVRDFIRAGGEIKKQLERNFRADDVSGYLDRRRKLREAFGSVPKIFAQDVIDQLMDKNDPLAKLFNYKISRYTRNEMISILLSKIGQPT